MDQNQNGQLPAFLKHLLTNPFAAGAADVPTLQDLVQKYPACSIFHFLLAKASEKLDQKQAAIALHIAAAYAPNRQVLYNLMFTPEKLKSPGIDHFYPFLDEVKANIDFVAEDDFTVESESEKYQNAESFANADASFIDINPANEPEEVSVEEIDAANSVAETTNADPANPVETVFTEEESQEKNNDFSLADEEAIITENEQLAEDVNLHFINEPENEVIFAEEDLTAESDLPENQFEVEPEDQSNQEENNADAEIKETESLSTQETKNRDQIVDNEIDEEVYDEITAIEDIRLEHISPKTEANTETPQTGIEDYEKEAIKEAPNRLPEIRDEADKTMLSSIASIDYFTFNNRFGGPETPEQRAAQAPENVEITTEAPSATLKVKETETVSNYHDDTLPYSFTWWLHKMRKQYAGTYQPYQPKNNDKNSIGSPELQQQYIESIFQSKPAHELVAINSPATSQPPVPRKEDDLIRRFIVEEPHIHPPSSDKLDTENKAKKSAEDADALVTETLAKVYLDQMLYHKALDTYKRLLLKFPEKKLYFADQIESIEKKIN